jgi:hypothetical protein
MRCLAFLVVMAGLSSCGFGQPMKADEAPPGPYDWRLGYAQGCDSAWDIIYVGFRKDQTAYATNQMYRDGWDDGYRRCWARSH